MFDNRNKNGESHMCNIMSYRVREYDKDNYVVESYSMKLEDEIKSYTQKETVHKYYIRTHSYIRNKHNFKEYIRKKCVALEDSFDFDVNILDENRIDKINTFLATHYFVSNDKRDYLEEIKKLNQLAKQYITEYNEKLLSSITETSDNSKLIKNKLKIAKRYLKNEIDRIECLNVGQANCSMGYHGEDNQPLAIFDLGVRSGNRSRRYVENRLGQVDGRGIVVISHYDSDHIDGCRYLGEKAADRIWILPQKRPNPTQYERMLFNFIKEENCIFLNDVKYTDIPYNDTLHSHIVGNLTIYQGNANKIDSCQSTSENARSLICVVEKEKSILLPGDSLYEEFPIEFDVDYLIVPHHSCYYDKAITNINLSKLKEIVVFAGPNKGYHHPDQTHIINLMKNQCKVIYLMNHTDFCFNDKKIVPFPQLVNQIPSYTIYL